MCYLSQHGNLYTLQGNTGQTESNGYHIIDMSKQPVLFTFIFYKPQVYQRHNDPHHHRLEHVNECTVTPSLFQEGSAHRLLLRLLHQQIQVTDVLHGTVQLGAQVPTACARQSKLCRETRRGERCSEEGR